MRSTRPTARRLALSLAATAAASTLAFAPAVAAGGGGGGGAGSSGQCSTISGWTLEGQVTGTGIGVRADVLSKELDSIWRWRLLDDEHQVAKGTAVMDKERRDFTYFEVRRTVADRQRVDELRFVAIQTVTGEVCDGSLSV